MDHLGVDEAEGGDGDAYAVRGELDPQRPGKLPHAGLGHGVGRHPHPVGEGIDREDHDDVAAPPADRWQR